MLTAKCSPCSCTKKRMNPLALLPWKGIFIWQGKHKKGIQDNNYILLACSVIIRIRLTMVLCKKRIILAHPINHINRCLHLEQ